MRITYFIETPWRTVSAQHGIEIYYWPKASKYGPKGFAVYGMGDVMGVFENPVQAETLAAQLVVEANA